MIGAHHIICYNFYVAHRYPATGRRQCWNFLHLFAYWHYSICRYLFQYAFCLSVLCFTIRQRTAEGIQTARLDGKQIGQKKGAKLNVKKKAPAMEQIRKHSKDFNGTLKDTEVMQLVGVARNTYYKYKSELRAEAGQGGASYI